MKRLRLSSIRARMTALFGIGAAVLMLSSTSLLSWNTRREAENSARASLSAAEVSLREPLKQNASLEQIKSVLQQHNAKFARGGWANEVEGWLLSKGGAVKWRTGPYLPPRRFSGQDDQTIPPDGSFVQHSEGRTGHQSDRSGDHDGNHGGPPQDDGPPGDGLSPNGGQPFIGQGRRMPLWMQFVVPPLEDSSNWRHLELKRGTETLIIGVPWFRNSRALRSQMASLLFLGLLASAAAAGGAWLLVGRVLTPIDKLALQAGELAKNDSVEGRLSATSTDYELQHLTLTLNEMLQVLGEAARSKERFHTAASHELRTPLQALSGHLQVALSRERGVREYREALQEAARQTERLTSITRDLLILNQLQMATTRPPHESVDVNEIFAQSIDRFLPELQGRGVQVSEELKRCEVETAPSHIEMLVRNIVENAVKYVTDGGRIEFGLLSCEALIWNQTKVLPVDEDLERLFEPFFRPDASRHSSTGGNGLGLSICRAICDANGWEIHLEGQERHGFPGVLAHVKFAPPPLIPEEV